MPLVQEMIYAEESIKGTNRATIFSKIRLGVATKIYWAPLVTVSRSSDADIFSESFNSG